MSDENEAARQRAQNEKQNYPSGQPASQNETGYSWEKQKAYENEWNKKQS